MASRDLNDLKPEVRLKAEKVLSLCQGSGIDLLIYCTLRSMEEQARLYRQGRTLAAIQDRADALDHDFQRPDLAEILIGVGPQAGRHKRTWAGPGQSYHNYGLAFDGVPLQHGKPIWEDGTTPEEREIWNAYGEIGESAGLRWSGRWIGGKVELPHLQQKGANWRDLIRSPG